MWWSDERDDAKKGVSSKWHPRPFTSLSIDDRLEPILVCFKGTLGQKLISGQTFKFKTTTLKVIEIHLDSIKHIKSFLGPRQILIFIIFLWEMFCFGCIFVFLYFVQPLWFKSSSSKFENLILNASLAALPASSVRKARYSSGISSTSPPVSWDIVVLKICGVLSLLKGKHQKTEKIGVSV